MKKISVIFLSAFLLSACVHKIDIQQGNILDSNVSHLHRGMSATQVKSIMGSPVLINTFADNRVDYVYTFKPGGGKMREQYVTLIFYRGILKDIRGNMYSAYIK